MVSKNVEFYADFKSGETFLGKLFCIFSRCFEITVQFCVFSSLTDAFFALISIFFKLTLKQMRPQWHKKSFFL